MPSSCYTASGPTNTLLCAVILPPLAPRFLSGSAFILPQPLPRRQHQPPRPVLPVHPLLLLLQHPERLAREVQCLFLRQQVRPRAGRVFPGIQDVF
jgi:hypothetical protein